MFAWWKRVRTKWRFRVSVVLVVCTAHLLIWNFVPTWRPALFPPVPLFTLPIAVWFDVLITPPSFPLPPPTRLAALGTTAAAWATALLLILLKVA